MTKRAIWISQSKALSPVADETAPPTRADRYREAFPTATSLDAGQDRENIPKTSAMPHESFPRVTSLGGDEGSLKQKLKELMEFSKEKVFKRSSKQWSNRINGRLKGIKGDAEKDSSRSTDKGSESTGDLANVLSSMGAANILASGVIKIPLLKFLPLARDTTPGIQEDQDLQGVLVREETSVNITPSVVKVYPYFESILKDFDKDDLVTLWKLVKDRSTMAFESFLLRVGSGRNHVKYTSCPMEVMINLSCLMMLSILFKRLHLRRCLITSVKCLCVAVVVIVSMWLSSILRKVSSVDLAFLFKISYIDDFKSKAAEALERRNRMPIWHNLGLCFAFGIKLSTCSNEKEKMSSNNHKTKIPDN
ncbi:hypothetical protein Tco_0206309 [Tanacetum coccineum]